MTFERAVAFVLKREGGFSDDPRDPGGATKFGISARAYPDVDIANLTIEQATAIYRRDYWDRIKGDLLPAPLALMAFDAAVNQGPRRAIQWLQHAVAANADGVVGPETIAKAIKCDVEKALLELAARRAYAYGTTKSFETFGLGWSRRLAACLATALKG